MHAAYPNVRPARLDQRGIGGEQGLHGLNQRGIVTARSVRDADHTDHRFGIEHRQAQGGVHCRMTGRQAAAAWIMTGVIRDDGLATSRHMPEQGVWVPKLEPGLDLRFVERPILVPPGNVGDGVGAQNRRASRARRCIAGESCQAPGGHSTNHGEPRRIRS